MRVGIPFSSQCLVHLKVAALCAPPTIRPELMNAYSDMYTCVTQA